ncbi:MAG: NAD(+) synthase [Tepidisphaeraceae bacterium]|jgi:NAD+ synthase (glutamine-hydrolysing)
MNTIKIAAAALNQTPLDWAGNRRRILSAISEARRQGAEILCLPELCITGYGCEDMFHSAAVRQRALDVLTEILPATEGIVVSIGLPLMFQNGVFNVACLVVDGRIGGFVAKRFLAGDGIHYEPRWFKAWPTGMAAEIAILGQTVPLGDIHFDVGGVKLGFEICEDAWVAKRPGGALSLGATDVILNPSASHFAFGKIDVRRRLVLEGSRAFGVTYVYANLLGNEAGRAIYDGGAMIASSGRLVAEGPRFSFREFQVICATVNLDATRSAQARTASFSPDVNPDPRCFVIPFSFVHRAMEASTTAAANWESGPHRKEEEFVRAEALGLFDYLRKSRSRGFVVSLSGGADSAAVACLCSIMIRLALRELGSDELTARLSDVKAPPRSSQNDGGRDWTGALLTCVYQATRNSSAVTESAAREVANAIGAEFLNLNVDPILEAYWRMMESALGRPLTWNQDDIALQNIQARVRSPGVWMLANIRNALLLSTSNRSEAAVGYATMDGDTSGGLAPIAGIDKAFLRQWLRWLEIKGPEGLGPTPALAAVNRQQPAAELRPESNHQTDEDDLMAYDVLDFIERAAIRDKLSPAEVMETLAPAFTTHSRKKLAWWVLKFFRLWSRNQWKRERYAPSFHLDDENLDPKTWCRFPILSGGFEEELSELCAREGL